MARRPVLSVAPQRGHALLLITVCFLASGLLRLGTTGSAFADQVSEQAARLIETDEADALLTAIQERAAQLDQRERRIAEQQALLELSEEEFQRRRSDLIAAEERLAATLAIADEAAENDIQRLTAVYQNMKPKNAAVIFDSMDPVFAAGFLIRMAPEAAAGVLSAMTTETAYTVSVIMASRNATAPTE
ncbi:MAG: hypothetical protein AAF281_10590 [Pseudomonadota bacterium]